MSTGLECIFKERTTIAEGDYTYRAWCWTKALLGIDSGDYYLILLAGVEHSLDDQAPLTEWINSRAPILVASRKLTRDRAIRLAVEDADGWRARVVAALDSFPSEGIKGFRFCKVESSR